MARLTQTEILFLKSQNISLSLVFDATGLSGEERKQQMKLLEKPFYYGGALCNAGGHSLRSRSGHCIQCDTAKIAYQLRSSASGYVYLAYSPSTTYVKVGYSAQHPQERADLLRKTRYGNVSDWDVKRLLQLSRDAGKTEFAIHAALEKYQRPITYWKGHDLVECREIFVCSLEEALRVFDTVVRR